MIFVLRGLTFVTSLLHLLHFCVLSLSSHCFSVVSLVLCGSLTHLIGSRHDAEFWLDVGVKPTCTNSSTCRVLIGGLILSGWCTCGYWSDLADDWLSVCQGCMVLLLWVVSESEWEFNCNDVYWVGCVNRVWVTVDWLWMSNVGLYEGWICESAHVNITYEGVIYKCVWKYRLCCIVCDSAYKMLIIWV